MDIVQDWTAFLYRQITPSRLQQVQAFLTNLPYLFQSFLDKLSQQTGSPITAIAVALVILLISLKLLNMLYSMIMWWFWFAIKIVFVGAVALAGCYIWARGPEGVIDDVGGVWSTWQGEYVKHKDNLAYAKAFYQQAGFGAPGAQAGREGRWNNQARRGW